MPLNNGIDGNDKLFDLFSRKEHFSANPVFVKEIKEMTDWHRGFHRTAHELQVLFRAGPEKNRDQIRDVFTKNIAAADKVIATFQMMVDEASRARSIYDEADAFASGELLTEQKGLSGSLASLIGVNNANTAKNSADLIASGKEQLRAVFWLTVAAFGAGVPGHVGAYREHCGAHQKRNRNNP